MGLSKELLQILACPKCKQEIYLTKDEKWLACKHCKLKYPIREEIPVMLIEEAEKFDG
jgi:uncharacterized protein YbaR (Trm112 family)